MIISYFTEHFQCLCWLRHSTEASEGFMSAMAADAASAVLSSPLPPFSRSLPSSLPPLFSSLFYRPFARPSLPLARSCLSSAPPPSSFRRSSLFPRRSDRLLCRAAEYKFPDPIPEFALDVRAHIPPCFFGFNYSIYALGLVGDSLHLPSFFFLVQETTRFRTHMLQRLTKKKEYFGDSVGEVVDVCTEVYFRPKSYV